MTTSPGPIGPAPRRGRGRSAPTGRPTVNRGRRGVRRPDATTALPGRRLQPAQRRRQRRLLMVTGGSGFLGRHIVNGIASEPWELYAPDRHGLDLRNPASVHAVMADWRPAAVIHTAYRRNDHASTVDATRHVAEAAAACGARLIHVSSDAVFRGGITRYGESHPVSPVNEYGRHKADAELVVASTCPDSVIVRTSLLLGRRQVSPHEVAVWNAIQGTPPMTFFTDEIRCPVIVDDLAACLVELAARPEITGVLHLAGPDELSRADLARLIAQRYRWDASKLRFGTLAEAGLQRPGRVVLDSSLARSYGLTVRGPIEW